MENHRAVYRVGYGVGYSGTHVDGQRLLGVEVFHHQLQRPARVQLVEVHERLRHALEEHQPLLLCQPHTKITISYTFLYHSLIHLS